MKQTVTPTKAPSPPKIGIKSVAKGSGSPTTVFLAMALNMTWKLAIVVLAPILLGNWLNHKFQNVLYLIGGITIAFIGSTLVIRGSYKLANKINQRNSSVK